MRGKYSLKVYIIIFIIYNITMGYGSALSDTDHSGFSVLSDFTGADGPTVTKACLVCHDGSGGIDVTSDFDTAAHNTWPNVRYGVNNFYNIFKPNGECLQCHIGYAPSPRNLSGWIPVNASYVDCLICHADDYERELTKPGPGVDLTEAAQSVRGYVTREACLRCHAFAGGGNKQGDMGVTMASPRREEDVHMSPLGEGFLCTECHITEGKNHRIPGADTNLIESEGRFDCIKCHDKPHGKFKPEIDRHATFIACQTCHITQFALSDPTNTNWYYGTQDYLLTKELTGNGQNFTPKKNLKPVYKWWDGNSILHFNLTTETVLPDGNNILAGPVGIRPTDLDGFTDSPTKIYPFYEHKGSNPYDISTKKIMPFMRNASIPNGSYYEIGKNSLWKYLPLWANATINATNEWSEINFGGSGENLSFVETRMYLSMNHQVRPKEYAYDCRDCHKDLEDGGVLDYAALNYTASESANINDLLLDMSDLLVTVEDVPAMPPGGMAVLVGIIAVIAVARMRRY